LRGQITVTIEGVRKITNPSLEAKDKEANLGGGKRRTIASFKKDLPGAGEKTHLAIKYNFRRLEILLGREQIERIALQGEGRKKLSEVS